MSDESVAQFVNATQASADEAGIYLARANGDIQVAIGMYFAEDGESSSAGSSAVPSPISASSSTAPSAGSSRPASINHMPSLSGRPASSWRASLNRAPRTTFATFSDMISGNNDPPQPRSPDQLFTGGEKSGLAVTSPDDALRRSQQMTPRGTVGARGRLSAASNLVDEIVNKAQREAASGAGSGTGGTSSPAAPVCGRGFRLGSEGDAPADTNATVTSADEEEQVEPFQRTMYFWRDGFSIDDGPLYRFDDPRNQEYLHAINMGRAPIDLLDVTPQQLVDVRIVQRLDEEYVRPKVAPSLATAGVGQRLGASIASAVSSPAPGSPASASPAPITASAQASSSAAPGAQALGAEGDALVQIRLADGTTRRVRFIAEEPVQQLYDYVAQYSNGREFVLQLAAPPPRTLEREQKLRSAGAVGAVVVQRWV